MSNRFKEGDEVIVVENHGTNLVKGSRIVLRSIRDVRLANAVAAATEEPKGKPRESATEDYERRILTNPDVREGFKNARRQIEDWRASHRTSDPFNHPDVRRLVEAAEKLPAMFTALHSTEPIDPDEYRAAVCTDAAQIADEIAAALTPIQDKGENNGTN